MVAVMHGNDNACLCCVMVVINEVICSEFSTYGTQSVSRKYNEVPCDCIVPAVSLCAPFPWTLPRINLLDS